MASGIHTRRLIRIALRAAILVTMAGLFISVSSAVASAAEGESEAVNGWVRSQQSYAEPAETFRIVATASSCKYGEFISTDRPGNFLWDWVAANLITGDEPDPDDFSADLTMWGGWNNCLQIVWRSIPILGECDPSAEFSFYGEAMIYDIRSGTNIYAIGAVDGLWSGRCLTYDPPIGNVAYHVVDQHPVTAPTVELNPYVRGLVGLDTWSWYDTPAPEFAFRSAYLDDFAVQLPSGIDDIPITGDLWLESIRWDFDGDGGWDFESVCSYPGAPAPPASFESCAGSELNPVVNDYIYEHRGSHVVTVELRWTGYFDDPDGLRHYFLDTSPLTASASRIFDVIEIRSELWS